MTAESSESRIFILCEKKHCCKHSPFLGLFAVTRGRRLTPTYIWREQAKTYAHIYIMYVSFWELIIAFPNGG